eukprot:5267168-Pleurochrysis_carterae.AAC.3
MFVPVPALCLFAHESVGTRMLASASVDRQCSSTIRLSSQVCQRRGHPRSRRGVRKSESARVRLKTPLPIA